MKPETHNNLRLLRENLRLALINLHSLIPDLPEDLIERWKQMKQFKTEVDLLLQAGGTIDPRA